MRLANDNWQPWQPTESEPWNLQRVWHLHRRAGFAATWDELQRDLTDGPAAAIMRVLEGEAAAAGVPDDFDTMADTIGQAAASSGNPDRLKASWVYRMLCTPDPLAERLTLMWHNHFATSNLKVDDVHLMWQQNQLLHQHARGPFRELLTAVVKHPAMLVWLDAQSNRKNHPNENLARELMELFTIGVGHFSETDVKEAARCLTGWSVSQGRFRLVDEYHDDGEKTVLGQTGRFNGDDLLGILLNQPATAYRLAWRLCAAFFGENVVSQDDIEALAMILTAESEQKQPGDNGRPATADEPAALNVGNAVETILRSRLFYADANLRSRISGPVEFVVGTIRALELREPPPSTLLLAEQINRMGQDLFYPPTVFGWAEGQSWMNTRSFISRAHFAASLINGELHRSGLDTAFPDESTTQRLTQLLSGKAADDAMLEHIHAPCSERTDDHVLKCTVQQLLAHPEAQLC